MNEADKHIAPSVWCCREGVPAEKVVEVHENLCLEVSDENRKKLKPSPRIPYHDSKEDDASPPYVEQAFEWFPSKEDSDTVVVFIHGGFWQSRTLRHSAVMAHTVTQNWSYHFVPLGYTTAPTANMGEIVQQTRRGILHVLRYAQKQGVSRVFVMGHSAGGHLAATLLLPSITTESETITASDDNSLLWKMLKGLILLSGAFDLRGVVNTYVNKPLKLTDEEASRWDVFTHIEELRNHVKEHQIAILVAVGENDPPYFKEVSQSLHDLVKEGIDLETFPEKDHFQMVESLTKEDDPLTKRIHAFINRKDA